MNLMKLFNKNYLIQNLKKSRVVLAIFTCLIPILNTIVLTMMITSNKNHIISFGELSIINLIGLYFLPIIISICLFNYIYKKKSVDFIGSMPISRRSVFVTNTILSIIIFILMLLSNIILISLVSLIFNTSIPFMMMFDYFWYCLVIYVFAFSATNLAMTISGNAITQIVVTMLLFFLIPFSHAALTVLSNENINSVLIECHDEVCIPDDYYCYDNLECTINKNLNKYEISLAKENTSNYTAPFALLHNSLIGNANLINIKSVLKMLILTVVYTILGYYLFKRRKMEVSETSFKSVHIHNLVKSLTLVPMVYAAYYIFVLEEIAFIIFVIVLMLIYYFVYDLITKKSITNIKLSIIYFTITISLLTAIFSIVENSEDKNIVINYNDIKEVSLNIGANSGRVTNQKLYLDNQELINIVIKELLNKDNRYNNNYIRTYLKTKAGVEYKTTIMLDDTTYDKVINILSLDEEYIDYYKNINFDKVYAIKVGNKLFSRKEGRDYIDLIKNSLNKLSLKEFLDLQRKYSGISDDFYIKLYTYEDHDSREFLVNGYINYDLLNSIVKSNNALLKENITNIIPDDYAIYYLNSYFEEETNIDYFVLRSAKKEVYEFLLKDLNNNVDMKKEYIALEVYLNGSAYQFTTNNIDEFMGILNKKYDEIKDSEEYQDYTNSSYEKVYVDKYD